MDSEQGPYEEGKRAGAHPVAVIIGVILGLWLLIWLYIPNPKHRQGTIPEGVQEAGSENPDEAPVMYQVTVTLPDMNAISVLVPPQATDSQIIGLLRRFRDARLANTLSNLLPPTTPGNKMSEHAVADIYVFSAPKFATQEVVEVLARGAHAPGEFYPQAIPFEAAMEQVRGHYRINLENLGNPDRASLGFADESGVHSRHFHRIF